MIELDTVPNWVESFYGAAIITVGVLIVYVGLLFIFKKYGNKIRSLSNFLIALWALYELLLEPICEGMKELGINQIDFNLRLYYVAVVFATVTIVNSIMEWVES